MFSRLKKVLVKGLPPLPPTLEKNVKKPGKARDFGHRSKSITCQREFRTRMLDQFRHVAKTYSRSIGLIYWAEVHVF
jgi:hypothetical protein